MNIKEFLDIYKAGSQAMELSNAMMTDKPKIFLQGLTGSSASIVAACQFQYQNNCMLFVLNSNEEAQYFYADLFNLLEGKVINQFPASYRRSFVPETFDNNQTLERAETLNRLTLKDADAQLIVTTSDALCEKVLSKLDLQNNTYQLKVGDTFDLEFFIEFLSEHHFERSDFVYEAGQFSIRGGIIDVFSFSNALPYRIVLDGENIETIRTFNPTDQLSVSEVNNFFITPNIQKSLNTAPLLSIFEYLPANSQIWFKDLDLTLEQINAGIEKARKSFEALKENKDKKHLIQSLQLVEPKDAFIPSEDIKLILEKFNIIEFGSRHTLNTTHKINFNTQPQPSFNKNFKLLTENLKSNTSARFKNIIFSDSSRQIERLYTIFDDLDKEVQFEPIYHALSEGFIDKDLKLICYTDHQIFDRHYQGKVKNRYSSSKILTLKELRELKAGDFVTHADHGIGKFAGLEKIDINGQMQEAVRLIYRDNDLLYVSINSLHKISKYVGKEGTEPRLNKIGSDAWEKLKSNTKKKVKDIARDLIKLYAKRKTSDGFAFNPDNYLQIELEASFMYEDTPDQAKATIDVKTDMEKPIPMDRLVCGDVGFGKTEVAVRAAFKAACDSKQVAILVPTTILANQHYRTFKERLKDFPVNIDYVNRFKSASESKEVLKKAAEGKIDILIGTHKILSKDVKFKNLGLLIIDEEQKFGVAAKEKLKTLRANVDTLTLTATPIPRTLHFSLMGARDLSVINTPPPNRQPVTTELHNFNDELIREAIIEEFKRGGQTFFVHHRVKDIYEIADYLKKICPEVSIGVAHGKLEGDKLEDVMVKFIEGEYDVLVATTIIEAGLDISNANTIIINNAHMFGLSDLHQMRGRVGRSNKKAFCYLLVPSILTLTNDARRRLSAIEEFSDLGSGFNVAMRDLDIRGAGNLLGGEQSGFIAEIGFEMYHKILDEAVHELKEEEFSELFKDDASLHKLESNDCNVETDFEALIPDNYVRNISERLSLYNTLSNITDNKNLDEFTNQLIDRFGKLPEQVIDLINLIRVREAAKKLGIERLVLKNKKIVAYLPAENKQHYYQSDLFNNIIQFVNKNSVKCNLKQTTKGLTLVINNINTIKQALHTITEIIS